MQTLQLQVEYDSRLTNSTHDALTAFQLNTINSDTSDLANSKLRDIEASVNTFFNSVATNFNMAGYNQDILKEYVPALVYTMYDGYYIYSPYINTLDDKTQNEVVINEETGEKGMKTDAEIFTTDNPNATYHEGERISGLKPYIYYSCRYKYGSNDFVITYSLDNYITIQGIITIDGQPQWVYDHGYLLDNITTPDNIRYFYRGIEIEQNEKLEEYVYDPDLGTIAKYEYIKINGVKYYYDNGNDTWFSILNNEKYPQDKLNRNKNMSALLYYKEAFEFTNRVKNMYKLDELKASNAVNEDGSTLYELDGNGRNTSNYKFGNDLIFDFGNANIGSIEDPDSNFNQHRLAVIRYCIEKELSIAIANYNNYTNITTNFQMPKLREDEWEKIINNASIISFLQGLSIGGKIYNGYSIITNNKNEEVVQEDSIYILENNEYHLPNEKSLVNNSNIVKGILSIDFEIKRVESQNLDYIPQGDINNPIIGSYTSIVNMTNIETVENYYEYMAETAKEGNTLLAQKYFTALGRERYSQYKTNNNSNLIKAQFST